MLRKMLCRSVMKPPFLQDNACSKVNFDPHSQVSGIRDKGQPNRMAMRSLNCCFVSVYPSSSKGRVVNQIEDPSSQFKSFNLLYSSDILLLKSFHFCCCFDLFEAWILCLVFSLVYFQASLCWTMKFARSSEANFEFEYSLSDDSLRIGMSSPPSRL